MNCWFFPKYLHFSVTFFFNRNFLTRCEKVEWKLKVLVMAEENRGRGYCPTYGEGNDSRQLDVAITMVNIETAENKVGNFHYLY